MLDRMAKQHHLTHGSLLIQISQRLEQALQVGEFGIVYFGVDVVHEVGDADLQGGLVFAPLFECLPEVSFAGCNQGLDV